MKLLEIALFEHYVNLHTPEEKQKLVDEVWEMLEKAYAPAGGFKSASSKDDLVHNSSLWKLVRRAGKIVSVVIYKDQHGRKSIAIATDGSEQGKKDLYKLKLDDLRLQRSWCEASGKIEAIIIKLGGKPLSNKFAEMLTGKKILGYDVDGIHYTRLIAGEPHSKVIFGFPELSDTEKEKIENSHPEVDLTSIK